MATDLARKLRRNATWPEQDFWRLTWSLRQAGWKFRRQHQIGRYYVDFVCLKAALVIEIDGDTHGHATAQSNDAVCDDYLKGRGFSVLRFSNLDVSTNPEGVFTIVDAFLKTRALTPPPQPSPQGGGSHIAYRAQYGDNHQPSPLPLVGRVGVGGATRSNPDEDEA